MTTFYCEIVDSVDNYKLKLLLYCKKLLFSKEMLKLLFRNKFFFGRWLCQEKSPKKKTKKKQLTKFSKNS